MMCANLIRLWRLTGNDDYRRDADDILAAAAPSIAANLFATTGMLSALDFRLDAVDVVLVTSPSASAEAFRATTRQHWNPNIVVSVHQDETRLPLSHPAHGKASVAGVATAYVCRGETCSLPVTTAADLATLLSPATPASPEP